MCRSVVRTAMIYSAVHTLLHLMCTTLDAVAHTLSPCCAQVLVESAAFRSYRGSLVPIAAWGDSQLAVWWGLSELGGVLVTVRMHWSVSKGDACVARGVEYQVV